jgi:hypothetical protein
MFPIVPAAYISSRSPFLTHTPDQLYTRMSDLLAIRLALKQIHFFTSDETLAPPSNRTDYEALTNLSAIFLII